MINAWYWIVDTLAGWNPWHLRRELRFRGYQVRIAQAALSGIRIEADAAIDHVNERLISDARTRLEAILEDAVGAIKELDS